MQRFDFRDPLTMLFPLMTRHLATTLEAHRQDRRVEAEEEAEILAAYRSVLQGVPFHDHQGQPHNALIWLLDHPTARHEVQAALAPVTKQPYSAPEQTNTYPK